ncbi:putative oxidoreductase C-terminal domain-containing protein [Steroidobacter sp.]|uniref:putative oxidoreductase C-terminal domain-containing protein n=1 Tax=Steroidobacter sp. TaxID=1978227 RepID=UPI001A5796DA|nr:putative oxidoreductase C-terminal domain-containing protein [Steroidobacter sp.]MBL8266256.1 Gfo/Idh/MocA family oxidoreductase [Steroidobacter sp.]
MRNMFKSLAGAALLFSAASVSNADGVTGPVRLMTLDPGHFHAALVQKYMYQGVDPLVHVYAPKGDDVLEHLKRIDGFNSRTDQPTRWRTELYTGPDYLQRMLTERRGNVVVISGNNAHKAQYILSSIEAGLNVLADKPMVIVPADLEKLQQAFALAQKKGTLLYDIMTERFEITSILQRELSRRTELFGTLLPGTPTDPAIRKESVHHFAKIVAGAPLKRPQWFFDVRQQGEGLVDVTTHLVDLVQWQAFPEQVLKPEDAKVLTAKHSRTPLTLEQFRKVTGAQTFPEFLQSDVQNGMLNVYANGEFTYRLRNVYALISVKWDFEAPAGGGDTHFSVMRGSKASLTIQQGAAQQFKPVLYIERHKDVSIAAHEAALTKAIASLQTDYPGVGVLRVGERWAVTVPEKYHVGHEAHFAQVTETFLKYLRSGQLPAWEVPNMLTKYATLMQAYRLSRVP